MVGGEKGQGKVALYAPGWCNMHLAVGLTSCLHTAIYIAVILVAALPQSTAIGDHEEEGSWGWYHKAVDGLILAATAIFVAIGLSHLAAAWILRKDFDVAIR